MKKLFLASYAPLTVHNVVELLPNTPDKLKLAFIPTASNPDNDTSWTENRDKLIEMGFHVTVIDIAGKTKDFLQNEFKSTDAVFVSGGNTYYLLEKAKECGFDEIVKKLIEKGVVYIGSSAGTILACPTIEYINNLDDKSDAPSLKSYEGLNIIDFLILPHYGNKDLEEQHKRIVKEWRSKGY